VPAPAIVSQLRPALVDVWIFRVVDGLAQILLLHRAPGRVLSGLWQGVSGATEHDETIVAAALRETREETGIAGDSVEAFYHLDFVAQFLWQPIDSIMSSVYFALRVSPATEPVLSDEHDAYRWVASEDALDMVVWPAYAEAIRRVAGCLLDPRRAPWFEVPIERSPDRIDE
jgi:8-oxo-dGTP pyrophosphatase MutT (NUDIX family)